MSTAPTLRTSTVQQINDNIILATLVPEIFPPVVYQHGAVIPLPTSSVDGYHYSRAELFYLWSVENTGPPFGSTYNIRLSVFAPSIDWITGVVTVNVWRMPPGGPIVLNTGTGTMRVIVIGVRQVPVTIPPVAPPGVPSDVTSLGGDYGVYDVSLFASGVQTLPSEVWASIIPPRRLNFQEVGGAVGAPTIISTATAKFAPAGDVILSLQKNGIEFAIVKFFAGNRIGIVTSSPQVFIPPYLSSLPPETFSTFNGTTDELSVVGPATPDSALADVGIVLAMKRVF